MARSGAARALGGTDHGDDGDGGGDAPGTERTTGRPASTRPPAAHPAAPAPAPAGPAAARAGDLDRLIHERMRLGIVSALAVNPMLTFSELRDLLGASDGNLSVHARKLEDAGYVACDKSFDGRVPRTEYRLTDAGRAALGRYLDHMEALIHATRPR